MHQPERSGVEDEPHLIDGRAVTRHAFDQHGKIVNQALAIGKVAQNRALKKSWSNFTAFKSGSSQNLASLFTVDNSQIFGALVSKDHGTAPYKDWITDANTSQTNIAGVSALEMLLIHNLPQKSLAVRTLLNLPHKACLPCAT